MTMTLTGSGTGTVGVPNSAVAQNTTSGTSVTFSGIPSGIKRITVMLSGVSLSGSSVPVIRLGSGGITSTGYNQAAFYTGAYYNVGTTGFAFSTNNFPGAAALYYGTITLTLLGNNIWTACGNVYSTASGGTEVFMSGSVTLPGTLDRVALTTEGGTDTYDAGIANILYE